MVNTNTINISFLIFTTRIAYPNYDPYRFMLYMLKVYSIVLKQRQKFTLQVLNKKFLKGLAGENNIFDVNNTVVVHDSNEKACPKFGILFAQLNDCIIRRKVVVVSKKLQSHCSILISNNLSYNLKGAVHCFLKECDENIFKYVDEVELSLISSPKEWNRYVVDNCLKNYFKTPKILYEGDVIEINLNQYGKAMFHTSNKLININDNIHFKCNKVFCKDGREDDGYLCVTNKSSLKLTADVQSFIPKYIYNDEKTCVSPPFPEAFDTYFEDMKSAVYPFLSRQELKFKPLFLLEGRKGSGKSLLVRCLSSYFGIHLFTVNNFDVSANVYAQNETKMRNVFFAAKMSSPCILKITNFENFGRNNDGQYDERIIDYFINELAIFFQNNDFPVILFCCCNDRNIPTHLKRIFLKSFVIKAPNEQEREKMLQWILKNEDVSVNVNLTSVANKTHGFLFEDLKSLVHYAVTDFYQTKADRHEDLSEFFFNKALDFMQSNFSESIGAPKVPKVKWSDVGGLTDVKEEIIKTIKLPLKHPKLLKQTGLKRSGILLFGPPGTGKTLIAKAVATECGLCFLSVKGPELLNMYVGQSEQNIREVFEKAREASPCIIFFDELDSLAPNRGASGDSGGVMDRVVSQLLAEMDGLSNAGNLFIIGATNRPDLIDPALLRPGRFDKLLYVGPCVDRNSKCAVLEALTTKFKFSENLVIERLVDMCPENFSGADFYGICSNAWMSAVRRLITSIESESDKRNYGVLEDVIVTLDDFKSAIRNIKPSIKQEDLEYFDKLKQNLK